jgi:hypothetical protein
MSPSRVAFTHAAKHAQIRLEQGKSGGWRWESRRSSAPAARPGGRQGTIRRDGMPGGTRHHGVLAPGETRWLVPTTVTVYRHLSPCRHRLPGRAVEPLPSSPVASPGAGHGVPPRCRAADAVPPAVLPGAACGSLLPVTTRPCWRPGGLPAATRAGQPLARRGGGGGLPVARGGRTRFVAQAVCLTSTPARLSWGCTPSHALAHALARQLARSL